MSSRNSIRYFLAAFAGLWFCSVASADPIINDRSGPVMTQIGDMPTIQGIFNSLFGTSNGLNAVTDQSNVATFRPTFATTFTYLEAVAGYRGSNVLGIRSGNHFANIFTGHQPNQTEVSGHFSSSAQLLDYHFFVDVYANTSTLKYTVTSVDDLNPGGLPFALVYFGTGQQFLDPSIGYDGIFGPNDIIIAFEDLNRSKPGASDDDFNDIVVLIENINRGQPAPDPDFTISAPEPASLAVWSGLAAIGGIVAWRRKRRA